MLSNHDKLSLAYLDSNRDSVTPEEFTLLDQAIASGTWDSIITHVEKRFGPKQTTAMIARSMWSSLASSVGHMFNPESSRRARIDAFSGEGFAYQKNYEIAFEYAIEKQAHAFIRNMLSHEKVVGLIDQGLLFEYVRRQNNFHFQTCALIAIIKSPSSFFSRDYFFNATSEFTRLARIFFRRLKEDALGEMRTSDDNTASHAVESIRAVLQSVEVNSVFVSQYSSSLLDEYLGQLDQVPDAARRTIIEGFLSCLPKRENSLVAMISEFLYTLSYRSQDIAMPEMTVELFLYRFSLDSNQLIKVLDDTRAWGKPHVACLRVLIAGINPDDLWYAARQRYETYQWMTECMALDLADRAGFILAHPELLDSSVTNGEYVKQLLQTSLDNEGRKKFLEECIVNPDFAVSGALNSHLFNYDVNLIARYLAARHVVLPAKCLEKLLEKHGDCADLIRLLLARTNYRMTKQDLFKPLCDAFKRADQPNAIQCLLSYPPAFNLLKQYDALRGDGEFSVEEHGTLMHSVLAWYIANSHDHGAKFKELYDPIPVSVREILLKRCISRLVDLNQPTLRAYIIQSGMGDLIGIAYHPRLMSTASSAAVSAGSPAATKTTIYMPSMWGRSTMISALRKAQQQGAHQFAEIRSKKFNFQPPVSVATQTHAMRAAEKCGMTALTLEHRTASGKIGTILESGRLKTRQHIQGHVRSGKASDGLMNPLLGLDHPKSVFSFFIRAMKQEQENDAGLLAHFSGAMIGDISCFVFNGRHLLAENPHIRFLVIALYPYFDNKTIQLPFDHVLSSKLPISDGVGLMKIQIDSGDSDKTLLAIHQKMFELIFKYYIEPLPEPTKSATIEMLTNPQSEADYQLLRDFLDFIPLEWMVPGDVKLQFACVDQIYSENKVYNISSLREIASEGSETAVLAAITAFDNIEQYPFVVDGMLDIARKRKQKEVVSRLLQFKRADHVDNDIQYCPTEVYQIESLVQQILENHDNDSTFVKYSGEDEDVSIQSTLQRHTNHGGAHHAEMALLHQALGIKNLAGQNAMKIALADSITVKFGKGTPFRSLGAIRDTLLTYELTTLLASHQNTSYYKTHRGEFHPETGKGATNGVVALKQDRLFFEGKPYQITVSCHDKLKQVCIRTNNAESSRQIAVAMQGVLGLPDKAVHVDNDLVTLDLAVSDLIAALRQRATFYEGINVITEDGRLLLAERQDKGLASAGGHHSDKYSRKGIAYGLRSEFGLEFREPAELENAVLCLEGVKTISKTGIYVVSESVLLPTSDAQVYADQNHMPVAFKADPEEFETGSEVALTLAEMRGKAFYEVMPLTELCQYQLGEFKQYLETNFSEVANNMTFAIENSVQLVAGRTATNKIPSATFGRMTIAVDGELPNELKQLFDEKKLSFKQTGVSRSVYEFDESPLALLQAIKHHRPSVSSARP